MADLQRALEWAKNNPDDEKSKRLLEMVANNQINADAVEARNIIGDNAVGAQQAQAEADKKGFFQRLADQFDQRVQKTSEILASNDSVGSKVLQTFGQGAGVGADIVGETVGAGLSAVTPDAIEQPIKDAFHEGVSAIAQTDQFKQAVDAYQKFKQEHPELAGNVEAFGNIFNLGASLVGGSEGTKVVTKGAGEAIDLAGKGVAKTAETAGKVGEFGVSQATALQPSTIRQILDTPGAFTKEEMAKIDASSLANRVKQALDKRSNELNGLGKEYQAVRDSGEVVSINPNTIPEVLGKYGVQVSPDGKISLSAESVPLSQGDVSALERFISQYGKEQNLSSNAFLNTRQALDELARFDSSKTGLSEKISRDLRKAYDDQGKAQITGLNELDAKYAPEIRFMKKIKRDYLNPDGSMKDGALSKIANLTGANKDITLQRLETLIPGVTKDINIFKAVKDIELAQGKVIGSYARGGMLAGTAVVSGPVPAIVATILTSPQVVVPMIRAYAKLTGKFKGITKSTINKIETGKKLVGDEAALLTEAVNNASEKLQTRIKNIRPGMNIQDVNKMSPEQLKAIGNPKESLLAAPDNGGALKEKMIRAAFEAGDAKKFVEAGGTFEDMLRFTGTKSSGVIPKKKVLDSKKTPSDQLVKMAESSPHRSSDFINDMSGNRLFHGTSTDFEKFDMNKVGKVHNSDWGNGIYLTPDESLAHAYKRSSVQGTDNKGIVKEFYIDPSAKVKKYYEGRGEFKTADELKDEGYDAVYAYKGDKLEEVVVMNPNVLYSEKELKDIWKKTVIDTEVKGFNRDAGLTGKEADIQEKSIEKYVKNKQALVDEYMKKYPDMIANADQARTLFTDVGYNGANSRAVHEAASALNKEVWKRVLKDSPSDEAVLFAGGSGSGKTSVAKEFVAALNEKGTPVLDGNLSSLGSAERAIEEALKADKKPVIPYIYREPIDAFEGTIQRTLTNEKEAGRIVPVSVTASNHPKSLEVVRELHKKYGDLIDFKFIDNSRGAGNAVEMTYDQFSKITMPDKLKSKMREVAQKYLTEGFVKNGKRYKLTKEQYKKLLE